VGASHNNVCYADVSAAAAAAAQAETGVLQTVISTTSSAVICRSSVLVIGTPAAPSLQYSFVRVGGSSNTGSSCMASQPPITVAFQEVPCTEDNNTTQFIDGMTLGWGVAGAMAVVAALMMMKRGARGG